MGLFSGHLSTKHLMRFCHSMNVSLDAGIPMRRAVDLVGKNPHGMRNLVTEVQDRLEESGTLEDALRTQGRVLPGYVIEILSAGERSGHLARVFGMLADYFEKVLYLQRALWRQITYPLCVIVAATVIIPFVKGYVLANINGRGTGMLEFTLRFLRGWASPVFVFAAIVILARLGVFRPLLERLALDLPLVTAYTRRIALSRFLWTLSILLDSTVPLGEAIARAAKATGNRWLERDLAPAIVHVRRGVPFGEAFAPSRYLSAMMRQMIVVGETSGKLPDMLRKAAEYCVNDAQHVARTAIRLVEGALIVWIGFWILFHP